MLRKVFSLVLAGSLILFLFPANALADQVDELEELVVSDEMQETSVDSDSGAESVDNEDVSVESDEEDIAFDLADEGDIDGSRDDSNEEIDTSDSAVPLEDAQAPETTEVVPQENTASPQAKSTEEKKDVSVKPTLINTLSYKAHVAYEGWQKNVSSGKTAGTTGKSRAIEALQINADSASLEYSAHVQSIGWQSYVKGGEVAGTTGRGLRMEAIQIKVVIKGENVSDSTAAAFKEEILKYQAHVQNVGWQSSVNAGETAGTSGRSLRVEALKISAKSSQYSGSIQYSAHVQNEGWQTVKENDQIAGTVGKARRIEALRINLTGKLAEKYDVYYRLHIQNFGWLDWACNGADAGSQSLSIRVEAVQIELVPKNGKAPGKTTRPFISVDYSYQGKMQDSADFQKAKTKGATAGSTGQNKALRQITAALPNAVVSGNIEYEVHLSTKGWTGYVSTGEVAGDGVNNIEALRFKLTGELANYFDVYYRVHSQNAGWLGWTKNGANAGTTGYKFRVEAYQLKIVAKGAAAPGSTASSFVKAVTKDYGLDKDLARITAANGNDLRRCFNYVAGFRYISQSLYPKGNWKVPFAKEMIAKNGGNCYRSAALFCCLAEYLGYDAKVVSGALPSRSQGRAPHGWVEIRKNGTVYVCDPEIVQAYPSYNWYMITYANAPVRYLR